MMSEKKNVGFLRTFYLEMNRSYSYFKPHLPNPRVVSVRGMGFTYHTYEDVFSADCEYRQTHIREELE